MIGDIQSVGLPFWIAHFTPNQFTATGTTLPAATTIGNQDIRRMRSIQYRLLCVAIETFAVGKYGNLVNGLGDGISLPAGYACC